MSKVSKFQKFTTETLHRSALLNAEYNPRHMTQEAKVRLRDTLSRVGLVQPIVWNRTTGNIVGGHQRIRQLDALEDSPDYELTVAVVEVDEVREKELNVLLNNPEVCGEWDLEKLQDLLDTEGIDTLNTGFDEAELLRLFGEAPSQSGSSAISKEVQDDLAAVKAAYDRLAATTANKDDKDFYCVIIFGSYEDRKNFTDAAGVQDNRYVDGRVLASILRDARKAKEAGPTTGGEEVAGSGVAEDPADRPAEEG